MRARPVPFCFQSFAARAAYFALVFRFVRARALARQAVPHCLVQQVLVDLGAENIVGKLHLPDRFPFQIFYVQNWHLRLSPFLENYFFALRIKM